VQYDDGDNCGILKGHAKLTATGSTEVIGSMSLEEDIQSHDERNLGHINISRPPADFVIPANDPSRDEPSIDVVDNPGDWPAYCFRPTFESRTKTSKYKQHLAQTKMGD
jgi:hypothetical protein